MRALASTPRPVAWMLIAAVSLAAAPASAADGPAATPRPATLAGSVTAAIARADAVPAAALQQDSTPAATSSDGRFLSSRRGRIAAVLFVAGLVTTIVSRQKDAVHSPAR